MSSGERKTIRQACAVPYRLRDGKPEFCLITTARKKQWSFPKGIVDPGETPVETALKEAWEEAGLHGQIEENSLGRYRYSKWGRQLVVTVYPMQVDSEDEQWPEDEARQRAWCRPQAARSLIRRKALRTLLERALKRIDKNGG